MNRLAVRLVCVPRVLAILNRRMGNPLSVHDLADLSQNVLVLIWGKLATFEGRAQLETWASRFCFREFMNQLRRKSRMMLTGQQLESVVDSSAPSSVGEVSRREKQVERVQVALDRLGHPEATVIRLKHFECRTFKEIGALLEISPNTAKTYYYRGVGWLRDHVEQTETETEDWQ